MWNWQTATVTAIEQLNSTTRRFCLTVNDTDCFDFRAGQFVTFDLPISEKRLQRWRSYSIASAADGTPNFELCIVQLQGGAGTRFFFETVEIGTVLTFKGADGAFVLPETIETDVTMICTGTGIAPFRAMLQHIFNNNIPHKKLHLIFGTRYKTDILYVDEWRDLAEKHPEFSFSVALSREYLLQEDSLQEGFISFYKGYVHRVYNANLQKNDVKNDTANDTLNTMRYFICGWQAMIDETRKNLQAANIPTSQIHYELYG